MKRSAKRWLSATLALGMTASVGLIAACGNDRDSSGSGSSSGPYTYRSATTALATNWNPHSWETNADRTVLSYISTPFVDISIKDSEEGIYQWVYEMATKVTDVTKDHQSDLTKYQVSLPEGQTASQTEEGYVFEIALNPDATWENGEKITADDYIYSMQQLLNPQMKNYRANLYIAGESALAGGYEYYYSLDEGIYKSVAELGYATNEEAIAAGEDLLLDMWNLWGLQGAKDENGNECPQWVSISDTTRYRNPAVAEGEEGDWISASDIYKSNEELLEVGGQAAGYVAIYVENEDEGFSWDGVGCYKVDDYTIRYVNDAYINYNYFMTSLTSTWLVYKDLYEAGKTSVGDSGLVTTNYGTTKDTTMSYGVYKLDSLQEERQMVFVQNENWYGFEKQDDGSLISYTNFEVDGEKVQQYQTTRIVIDVLSTDAQKAAFLSGDLTEWAPTATDLSTYRRSERLYRVDDTYTMSLFFNTNLDALKTMDKSKGNQNSVVLNNTNFRKAFSLAINREDFVSATTGYKAAYSLMSDLYYYDIYNDPTSTYRGTDEAMQAICNLYGVEYGEGDEFAYHTLKEAYDSITGYNLTEAQKFMKQACDELVAEGIYKKGEPITIRMAWAAGALTSDDNAQITLMNQYINAAAEGSGFGTITLEGVGNLLNRYTDVPNGEYAIGYGAWGGAAFYPFRNFQVYMDPDQYDVNELGCWDPTTEVVTLMVNGEEETMTWQDWSNSMTGSGKYATADFDVQLSITAQLEEKFLAKYYRIPVCTVTNCSLLSYQCENYTENYNIMYAFGGLRLMSYNYDDNAWAAFVKSEGGQLDYV